MDKDYLAEIWLLQYDDGSLVPTVDGPGEPYLAYLNEIDAQQAADHQNSQWAVVTDHCRPVRVK